MRDRDGQGGGMPVSEMTHLSLFSGIGGLDLAAEWAGFNTVGQCEWADYPTNVLEKHWPDVPRWRDIRTLTRDSFYERTGLRTVEIISGGFPCQPFSVAGKRRGSEDDRFLWPEMLRVISEIRPTWTVGENVAGIVSMALDQVLSDMESIGYTTQALVVPACGVDAPHKRERCAIIGHTDCKNVDYAGGPGLQRGKQSGALDETERGAPVAACQRRENVPDTESAKRPRSRTEARRRRPEFGCGRWWPAEPDVGRVADGVPHRVDRLKCLGNAVVPQQFYPIFKAIADIELKGVTNGNDS